MTLILTSEVKVTSGFMVTFLVSQDKFLSDNIAKFGSLPSDHDVYLKGCRWPDQTTSSQGHEGYCLRFLDALAFII